MIWSRTLSVAPCKETARRIWSDSSASFRIFGARPRVDDPNRAQHIIKVGERFAHSHENNVVDLVAAFVLNRDHLIDNFVCSQIARESFQTARTKFASVSATDLG